MSACHTVSSPLALSYDISFANATDGQFPQVNRWLSGKPMPAIKKMRRQPENLRRIFALFFPRIFAFAPLFALGRESTGRAVSAAGARAVFFDEAPGEKAGGGQRGDEQIIPDIHVKSFRWAKIPE
jgi:hypothetical protein